MVFAESLKALVTADLHWWINIAESKIDKFYCGNCEDYCLTRNLLVCIVVRRDELCEVFQCDSVDLLAFSL